MRPEYDHIDDIVSGLLNKIEKKSKGNAVTEAWKRSVKENVVEHTMPVSFKKGVMMVIVENSSWLYKITMEKREIIKKFNEEYTGRQKLKDIRLRVGRIDI